MADSYGHLPRGPAGVMKATIWSIQGLRSAWLHESSFRLEVCLFAVLGLLLGTAYVEERPDPADADCFTMKMVLSHRWFGDVFRYSGRFHLPRS